MKNTLLPLTVAVAFASLANGATNVSVSNFNLIAGSGLAIVDNAGNPLSSVGYGVGNFTGAFSDADSIRATFVELGSGTTAATPNTSTNTNVAVSPMDDSPVYVVFYGAADGTAAADFASAADFIVIEGPASFVVEDEILGASVSAAIQDGTVVYGREIATDTSTLVGPFVNALSDGVTFGAVPEPSSALLSVLGLAFVARRRR